MDIGYGIFFKCGIANLILGLAVFDITQLCVFRVWGITICLHFVLQLIKKMNESSTRVHKLLKIAQVTKIN